MIENNNSENIISDLFTIFNYLKSKNQQETYPITFLAKNLSINSNQYVDNFVEILKLVFKNREIIHYRGIDTEEFITFSKEF